MEVLRCPSCGSPNLDKRAAAEYRCAHCGTRFVLTHGPSGFVDVVLVQTGPNQIAVIRALREMTDLELGAAKRLTDAPPGIVAHGLPEFKGEELKARLEQAGATVEIRPI